MQTTTNTGLNTNDTVKLRAVQVQEFGNGEMANTKKQSNETDGDQGNLEEKLIKGSRSSATPSRPTLCHST